MEPNKSPVTSVVSERAVLLFSTSKPHLTFHRDDGEEMTSKSSILDELFL